MNIAHRITEELGVKQSQVEAAINLLDEGSTVPFIARYRKEATAGLDDTQLRKLDERLLYLRELEDRRTTVIKTIDEQGKLNDQLKVALLEADSKTRLEDLYAPYKVKRRTKAQIAREAGIEPLLNLLLANHELEPNAEAQAFINKKAEFDTSEIVLTAAQAIFMERVSEEADLVGNLRDYAWNHAELHSTVIKAKKDSGIKFKDYFEFNEQYHKLPSHRALALFRGRTESVLRLKMFIPKQDALETKTELGLCDAMIAKVFNISADNKAADTWLLESVRLAWRAKVSVQIETELNTRLRESADEEAIRVFGENLRDLLLAAPAGGKSILGLDPGIRTGVKVVALDQTGKLLDYVTIYPHAPKNQWSQSIQTLSDLIKKHNLQLISIGNGTASRETDKLTNELLKKYTEFSNVHSLVVSEAGASVYSASELASNEFPDLDVSLRGAVSIARRLQDPLAELVKIEPKSIGVGQYQHDVNQSRMARKLDTVVEDCVNAVGVEINTASVPLLAKVAGLSESIANNIVQYRDEHGAFGDRQTLLKVPRLGPKAYEQAAGFLRINNAKNPLDGSAVHPEAYTIVESILKKNDKDLANIIGDQAFLKSLEAKDYVTEKFGEPTVRDIIQELEKPGRDPRPEFKTAKFKEGIEALKDLTAGLHLEGVITNVTNFGAFVDIGVHQDGLVHISALADKYVKDPREIVKTGDIVKVKVVEVDAARKRIALTMRLTDEVQRPTKKKPNTGKTKPTGNTSQKTNNTNKAPQKNSAMADAFAGFNKQ